MYEFGKIILVPFPFTDLTSAKLRPALIVSKYREDDDIIVAFISSKSAQQEQGIYTLKTSDPDFSETGLKVDSVVRFDKIATLNKKIVLGELGSVGSKTVSAMAPVFFEVFGFKA